jgi:hypothetical protein
MKRSHAGRGFLPEAVMSLSLYTPTTCQPRRFASLRVSSSWRWTPNASLSESSEIRT